MTDVSLPLDAATIAHLQSWQGRRVSQSERIHATPLLGLAATLDNPIWRSDEGQSVPPLGHWMFFLPQAPQAEIAADGHPHKGSFLPPVPLPRRMWAGGRLNWSLSNPLRVGEIAHRHSTVQSVQHKIGRSGEMVFVSVCHEIHNAQGLCVSEMHDIVYRHAASPGVLATAPITPAAQAQWQRTVTPSPSWLFRYSALTFNAHRIHYDRPYATEVEGYPGLVVHGPLIATLLVDLVLRHIPQPQLAAFTYRALRPSFDTQPITICGKRPRESMIDLWAQDSAALATMSAQVTLGNTDE